MDVVNFRAIGRCTCSGTGSERGGVAHSVAAAEARLSEKDGRREDRREDVAAARIWEPVRTWSRRGRSSSAVTLAASDKAAAQRLLGTRSAAVSAQTYRFQPLK